MKKEFLTDTYFLESKRAEELYYKYAGNMPVIDYHCHLEVADIFINKPFESLYELWLKFDHYKWRLMRFAGIDEYFITGGAKPYEKFLAYAKSLEGALHNPLYIWSHLELRKYFGIDMVINTENAEEIWNRAEKVIERGDLCPRKCIEMSKVKAIFTTDDILSELKYHKALADEGYETKVLPTFRGDRGVYVNRNFIEELSLFCKKKINNLEEYIALVYERIDFFKARGAKASDFAVEALPETIISLDKARTIFEGILNGKQVESDAILELNGFLLFVFAKYICENGIALQLHIGAARNLNTRIFDKLGRDTGVDGLSDRPFIIGLGKLLDELEKYKALPDTIIYNLNPCYSQPIATLTGCFNGKAKVQFGPAWWFLDNKDGINEQLKIFAASGRLANFVGMLTDSRSFMSYTRHDYFRRLLCNFIANLADKGEVFYDEKYIGKMVKDICFDNAKVFFDL